MFELGECAARAGRIAAGVCRGTIAVALVGLLPAIATSQQDPPRLHTELKSGAMVLVQRVPEARSMAVHLFASSRGVADTPATAGWRHLLEHLVVKGAKGDLDAKLESRGLFLRAETTRDAMHVSILGPATELDRALDALKEILEPKAWTAEQIAHEVRILEQELALLSDSRAFSVELWKTAFGAAAPDPIGDLATMAKATPEQLAALHKAHFSVPNLVIVITGPFGLDAATTKARALLRGPDVPRPAVAPALAGVPGRAEVAGATGDARAAFVNGLGTPATAWTVAAALALATVVDGAFVTYTPSVNGGLVIWGQVAAGSGAGLAFDAIAEGQQAGLFEVGKALARQWMAQKLADPYASGALRGALLSQDHRARPDAFLKAVEAMTMAEFMEGMKAFGKERCVVGVGVAR